MIVGCCFSGQIRFKPAILGRFLFDKTTKSKSTAKDFEAKKSPI